MDPFLVGLSLEEAARHKKSRKDVSRALLAPHDTINKVLTCLRDPNYHPAPPSKKTIIDGSNNKERVIDRYQFVPEQVIHHVVMTPMKEVVLNGLYEHAYSNIPKNGVHKAQKRLLKWIRSYNGKKLFVVEADIHHAYQSVNLGILHLILQCVIKDEKYLDLLFRIIGYTPLENGEPDFSQVGLNLGNYVSPWLFHMYLKAFDHFIASFSGIKYLRYADNIFLIGTNKRKLRKVLNEMTRRLDNLKLTLNKSLQLYRFEYFDKKTCKVRGRAVNCLGLMIHHNRVTLRKSILKRLVRKINHVSNKEHVSWYDATSIMSRLAVVEEWDICVYYEKYVFKYIKLPNLLYKIKKHSKELSNLQLKMIEMADSWKETDNYGTVA